MLRIWLTVFALVAIGFALGDRWRRHEIAKAIRTGRLSIEQRVESVASQIETGRYHPVGR
jgi:hypothetical protein